MKRYTTVLSTTHVDAHGDVMTVKALADGKKQIEQWYIPVGIEHDPRIAPIGRVVSAEVTLLEDGKHALVGTIEEFEPGDPVPSYDASKTIKKIEVDDSSLFVQFDRTYADKESQNNLAEIGRLTASEPRELLKKAIEPISVITIGGAFTLGAIASGFFSKLGSDSYEALKAKIKQLMVRREQDTNERLFEFIAILHPNGDSVEVHIIITNPTAKDVDRFFDEALPRLDELIPKCLEWQPNVTKLVFEYQESTVELRFGVRSDGIPLIPEG